MRNPLVAVKSFLELLGERGDDAELVRSFLPVAVEELRRAERLLGLLASLREGEAQEGEAGNAAEAVLAVAALIAPRARRAGVRLETACADALPAAALGSDALRQVALNLALNALEVSPGGGAVRLAARAARGGIEIEVSDEGPGLGSAPRLAGARPGRRPARGRGLAITQRLLESAGGGLSYARSAAGGARLRAWVPARAPRGGRAR